MAAYPGAIATFTGFTSSHTLSADSHAAQHNLEQAEIVAVQTKVGTGSSTSASNQVLTGTGSGTSSWAQVTLTSMVTGVLPVANGGTGQTTLTALPLASPAITGVVSGGATYTSPTLTTPVIASFTSATHNHQNAAGGGVLTAAALPALDLSIQTLYNPIKFSVYRSAALTANAGTTVLVADTAEYDTGSNVDLVTNKGRFTVPASGGGTYFFIGHVSGPAWTRCLVMLYKNGSEIKRGTDMSAAAGALGGSVTAEVSAIAGDYFDIEFNAGGANAVDVGAIFAYFMGRRVATT